ncbi:MAG: protein-glutamate O-methyltransferase family protein, partial [Candidatus Heimdallarchaeota archaeon]|nr:protein-glutamate O-methyltransferase family protein [Candidatus Heimdallarchaeota archaeon]
YLREVNTSLTPMEISFGMNEIIHKETGVSDPLRTIKEESNLKALELLDKSKTIIKNSENPLFDAIKISIAGNIIDYGMKSEYNLSKTLEEVMGKTPFIDDSSLLKERLSQAKTVTFLADNAGEIVFDKLLIQQINELFKIDKIYLLVKNYPFMNDVTLEDVKDLGFEDLKNVEICTLENSTKVDYTEEILPYIRKADVIISKGQGNFEVLYGKHLGLFFLFIVKCELIGEILSAKKSDVIISHE